VLVGVCLCLSSNKETRKYYVGRGTDGVISFEVIGSRSGMNKPAK